ncbi:MAG: DUF2339 domain-containing protein [Chloroflexi bacterium]|nr:DUF2339 domain-containing protein [Chloroflexota bacterium]
MIPIRCPGCQRDNDAGSKFCTYCGTPLETRADSQEMPPEEPSPLGDDASVDAELRAVRQDIRQMGLSLDRLQDRLSRLEMTRPSAGPTGASSPPSARPLISDVSSTLGDYFPPIEGLIERFNVDWEQVLGKNWFAIIGTLALTIGAGFFLKLAFDNDWIGPVGRISLGIALGVAMLAAGEYSQRRAPLWAQPVTAGGIGILYLSIYAAFGLYDLILPLPAFLFLVLVVVLSVLLALRYESMVIALLGLVGAFLTPVLLGQDLPEPRLVLVYIVVIDLGILGISTFRNWRWFTMVGMAGSYGLFALWLDQFPSESALLVELFLTGVFLVFVGATTLFHIIWRRVPDFVDRALLTLHATVFYALTFGVLWDEYEIWFGGITLGISLLYGVVAYASIKRTGTSPEVALFALSIAMVFLTVAVPLQLSGNWVSVAWAAEGAILVWTGFQLARWPMRAFGLGVLAIAAIRLLIFDTPVDLSDFTPVLNERFPTFVVAIAAFSVTAYLYWKQRKRLEVWEKDVLPFLAGMANFLTLFLFTAEAIAYFDSQSQFSSLNMTPQDADNGKFLTLTAMWTIYAFGILAIGVAKRHAPLRWAGLGLLAIPVFKLLLFDTGMVQLDPLTFLPVINFHFMVFLIVLAALVAAAYLYKSAGDRLRLTRDEVHVFLILVVAANVVTLWFFSAEAVRYFDSQEIKQRDDLLSAMHLSLTVLWTVYAIGIIGVGIAKQWGRVRLAGMALLAVPVLKLFIFDIFLLERGYRVAAFVTLGGLLLAVGLVYQRYSQAIRGFLFGQKA